ncbi:hypothetical protein [Actinoplanes sp. OR16]|uniref:hypothetical protein n=1 Tax=Actinoplanes sp. OR16 TaxID=946334 RepID=UPI000FDA96B7|nr:hypothetical protein [Actinoplanes sp. OR16]
MNWLEFALLHAEAPHTVRVDGTEVGPCLVNERVIFCPPDTVAAPGAQVTLPGGRAVRVRDAIFMDSCGTGLPEHLQLDIESGGRNSDGHRYCQAGRSTARRNDRSA